MNAYKMFAISIIPFLSITYGFGELYGWWDSISGRGTILEYYQRLLHGNGYPKSFIYDDEVGFKVICSYIEEKTSNHQIHKLSSQGFEPTLITIDGSGSKKWPTPKDWPDAITFPIDAQILFLYGMKKGNTEIAEGKAAWTGPIYELKNWLDSWLDKQRFWVTVFLVSILSVIISLPDLLKSANKR